MSSLQAVLADPKYHDYLAILKGARNGLVYGAKVRFPHALIMAILFGRGDWMTRLRLVLRATRIHALNLAKFVSLYKTLLVAQKKLNGGKTRDLDSFIAGLLGGYIVFGDRTAINEQIVLYVCSRVVASVIPRDPSRLSTTQGRKPVPPNPRAFSLFAALSWGAVMWLFDHREETLQPGMYSSMTYLYRDSDKWNDWRTLLWRNT